MLHTAIIAFTLIGIMFLFSECGNKEEHKIMQRKLDKDGIPTYVTHQSKDTSYMLRDQEIALASYNKDEIQEESSSMDKEHDVHKKTSEDSVATLPEVEVVKEIEQSKSISVVQVVEINETMVPTVEANLAVTNVKSIKVPEVNVTVEVVATPEEVNRTIPPVPMPKEINTTMVHQLKIPDVPDVNVTVEPVVAIPKEVNITIPPVIMPKEINTTMVHQLKIPDVLDINVTVPATIKAKSMEEFASNSKMQDALNVERRAKDEVVAQNKLLEKQLEEERSQEEALAQNLLLLKNMAAENEEKARRVERQKQQELHSLLSQKHNLEQKVSQEREQSKTLSAKNSELSAKIVKLLAIAKEGTAKAEAEQNATQAKIQLLQSEKASLEANLTATIATKDELSAKVSELLAIAKEGTAKAEAEQNATQAKIQLLQGEKASLEANLTATIATKDELSAKVSELLAIAKEGTAKAEAEQNATQAKIQLLQSEKASLEANLTAMTATKDELSAKVSELLAIAKEGTAKAEAEQNATQVKIEGLLSTKESLESNLTAKSAMVNQLETENDALSAKISKLLAIAKEGTIKAEAEQNATQAKIQLLQSEKASLEANLTATIATKDELSAKVSELLAIAKEGTAKAEAEYNATREQVQGLLSQKQMFEANLTSKLENEKRLKEENLKLQEQLNLIMEEKAKAERLAKEKAEAERVASEKAAAEAKEKEEAQKVAEQKLLQAFSLTHVEFKFNSMELTDKTKEQLNKTAKVINHYSDFHYKIQGHTDSSGDEPYNVELSTQRANKVKEYLISQGVDAMLLSAEGFGSSQPIASNETEEGRLQNRRVVFEIIK